MKGLIIILHSVLFGWAWRHVPADVYLVSVSSDPRERARDGIRMVSPSATYAAARWEGIVEPARQGRKSVPCAVGEWMTPKRQRSEATKRYAALWRKRRSMRAAAAAPQRTAVTMKPLARSFNAR